MAKYTSASDSFRSNNLSGFIGFIALDRTGDVALVGPSGLVLDENFNQEEQIADSRSKSVAVAPDGDIGYQVAGSVIEILDLKAFLKAGTIEIGDSTSNANGRLAISGDGSLLAVITDGGFSVVRAKGEPIIPNRQFAAFSSAQTQMQSFVRLFNGDTEESTFNVALADLDTGEEQESQSGPYDRIGISPTGHPMAEKGKQQPGNEGNPHHRAHHGFWTDFRPDVSRSPSISLSILVTNSKSLGLSTSIGLSAHGINTASAFALMALEIRTITPSRVSHFIL